VCIVADAPARKRIFCNFFHCREPRENPQAGAAAENVDELFKLFVSHAKDL
jgi:hypothetical protein